MKKDSDRMKEDHLWSKFIDKWMEKNPGLSRKEAEKFALKLWVKLKS